VPDLRKPVVAKLAIGIADQIGHVRVIVVAERLQLLNRRGIVSTVVDRRIGGAVPMSEGGVVEKRLLGLPGLGGMSGLGARPLRVCRRRIGRRWRSGALVHPAIVCLTATQIAAPGRNNGS